jgi:hypothetical protein
MSLDICLPLSTHCGQASQTATVLHQGFQDEEPDFSR